MDRIGEPSLWEVILGVQVCGCGVGFPGDPVFRAPLGRI